jgi:hypothetical protein
MSCVSPCWNDLVIGESRKDEVLATTQLLTFVNQEANGWMNEEYLDKGIERYWVECVVPPGMMCASFEFSDDVLTQLQITPNQEISFREIVTRLHIPDYIYATAVQPEVADCLVIIAWIDLQMMAWHFEKGHQLCEDIRAEDYLIPQTLLVDDIYIEADDIRSWMPDINARTPWQGFID